MTTRDEVKSDNLRQIHASRFRCLYAEPEFGRQLVWGLIGLVLAGLAALAIAHILLPSVHS